MQSSSSSRGKLQSNRGAIQMRLSFDSRYVQAPIPPVCLSVCDIPAQMIPKMLWRAYLGDKTQ